MAGAGAAFALLLLTAPWLLAAGEIPRGALVDFGPVDPKAKVELYELTLDHAGDAGASMTFFVWCRGGHAGQAWATSPTAPGYCFPAAAGHSGFYGTPGSGLERQGNDLRATLFLGALSQKVATSRKFTIEATVAGTEIRGAFSSGSGDPAAKAQGRKGSVTGRLLAGDDLRTRSSPVAADAAYPGWRNDGSGAGRDAGVELVLDPSQARVAWKSEDLIPAGYYEGSNLGRVCDLQCGFASPVLAGGCLYLYYFVGNGKEFDKTKVQDGITGGSKERPIPVPAEMWQKKFALRADQIVVCLDAQTGQTVWKTVFPNDGPNVTGIGRVGAGSPNSKAPSHLTPCVGGGKVFAKGTGGTLYGLDAQTGALAWKSDARGVAKSADTDTCQFIDGVVATVKDGGLSGYDGETGKKLWTLPGAVGARQTHLRWVCGDREYFLTPKGQCVEPKTGKVLWTAEGAPGTGVIAADHDYLLCASHTGIFAFKITPQSATKAWELTAQCCPREIHPVLYKGYAFMRTMDKGETEATRGYHSICVEMATGKVCGRASGSKSFASVIAGDGRIFNCNAALVLMQNADPKDFRDLKAGANAPAATVADVAMPIVIQGTPETTSIYADGRVFGRTFDGVTCLDLRKARPQP